MKSQRPTLRNKSNPKNPLPGSQILEAETKKMEEKLTILKEMMSKVAENRETEGSQIRWRTATDKKPLKNYAKVVLEEKNRLKTSLPKKSFKNSLPNPILKPNQPQPQPQNTELLSFLQSINLTQYYDILIEKGFEDIEILREITHEILNEMKVPPGHQIKLLKALNKSEPRQIISSGITKRTDLIELPEGDNPLEEDNKKLMKVINNSEKAFIKENFIEKNIIKGSSVVHKGILPKNIPNEKSLTNVVEKTINTIERPYATSAQSKLRKKVSFKEITPLIPIVKTCCDEGIGTSPRTSPKSSSKLLPRLSCWNCFKLFEVLPFQAYSKSFCSGSCEGVFLSLNEQNCDKCGIKTLKQQGIFRNNSFFCNEKCAPKLEDLYKVWSLELKEEIIKEEAIIKKGDSTLIEEKLIIKEDFDLFQDLKGWGTKSSKTEGFLSMKELEEKYEKLNNSEK